MNGENGKDDSGINVDNDTTVSSDHNAEISETAPDATKESNINGPEESSLPRVEDESPTKSDVNEQAFCDVMGFNLASQEGQEHLRELNEELKALNEQGSPKLSLLHGPAEGGTSNSQECMDLEVKRNNKKRKRNVGHCSAMGSPVASKNSPERMHASKKKVRRKLLCTNDGEPSCSADSLEKRDDDKLLDTTEDEIDKILEEKAWKANLTTVNVKNILRYVVTNEHVLAMVRNSMQSDSGDMPDVLAEAKFEPKLTRSKAKELMEKQAKVPWPISPIKMPSPVKSKSLIDLEFSESDASSDEEYQPNNETAQSEDEESFVSPSTNEALSLTETSHLSAAAAAAEDNDVETDTSKLDPIQDCSEIEDTIALRTRSKLPLNDTPLEKIEAEFLAPDISADMYDSECDDDEWKDFLGEFLKPLDVSSGDGADDEANDPEYNFLEEDDVPDSEDLRDDRAVKISKKELHGLMAELFEEAEAELAEAEEEEGQSTVAVAESEINRTPIFEILNQDLQNDVHREGSVSLFSCEARQQLDEQLRKHVQLLTQTFILSFDVAELKTLFDMCKLLLFEIQTLADKNATLYKRPSAFTTYNLMDAVKIITTYADKSSFERVNNEAKRWQRLSLTAMSTLAHSNVFMYPELLPACGFRPPAAFKRFFVNAEDVLLALGLEQFLPLKEFSCWELIREHMIPVKSTKQICIRTKNLRSSKYPFNPVKYFYQNKRAPSLLRSVQPFDPENVKAPIKQPFNLLPEWMKTYLSENQNVIATRPIAVKESVSRSTRPLLPAPPSFIQLIPRLTVLSKNETSDAIIPSGASNPDLCCTLNSILLSPAVSGPGLGQSNGGAQLEKELCSTAPCLSSSLLNSASEVVSTVSDSCNIITSTSLVNVTTDNASKTESMTMVKTPDKIPGGCNVTLPFISPGLGNAQVVHRLSPLKRVSPIIKKYSQKRLRKTGGNLRKSSQPLQKIMPKIILPAVQYRPRSLAPKSDTSAQSATALTANCERYLSENESQTLTSTTKNMMEPNEPSKIIEESVEQVHPNTRSEVLINIESEQTQQLASGGTTTSTVDTTNSGLECKSGEQDDIPKDTRHEPLDVHESESEVEAEIFDDGEDTADDDVIDIQGDNEDDLAALMAASTTIKTAPRHRQNIMNKNKKLKDRKALLKMLECDTVFSDPLKEEKETAFAQAYLQRVKEAVGCNEKLFEEFIKVLYDFSNSGRNVVNLYQDVCSLLKDFPELCDEFVAFLLPEQAFECDKFMEHLSITKTQLFLKKIEAHFGKHPHHIQKIIKLLTHLNQQTNVTMDTIKASLLPLFRGQHHLIEEFLQLFPQEAPSESCMTDFEEVFMPEGEEEIVLDEDAVEVIEIPDTRDRYGNQDCICHCHVSSERSKVQNRIRHCVECGIKFIDGRVFLQTGKVLKPCQVNYLYPKDKPSSRHVAAAPNDVVVVTRNNGVCSTTPKRLTVESTEYASPSSSMSSLSPSASKESDSELENGTVLNKGPVAEAPTNGPQEASSKCAANRLLDVLEHISQDNTTTLNLPLPSDAVTEDAILTPDTSSQSGMQVPADFSILRSVINPPLDNCQSVNFEIHQCHGESQEDIRVTVSHVEGNFTTAADASKNLQEVVDKDAENSSEMRKQQQQQQQHRTSTTESELVKFETDGASRVSSAVPESPTTKLMADSDVFVNAKNHVVDGDGHVVVLWTRESDRILLQTCQQMGPGPEAFAEIASKLKNKSQTEVASRFQELMTLFSQQASKPSLKSQKSQEDEHESSSGGGGGHQE